MGWPRAATPSARRTAEQLEDHRLAVGRDVERDPRPLVGLELELFFRLERQLVLVGFLFLGGGIFLGVGLVLRLVLGEDRGDEETGNEDGEESIHGGKH
jgi:hypothetical protein